MARTLRRKKPLNKPFAFEPMPQLRSEHAEYQNLLPRRIGEFPINQKGYYFPSDTSTTRRTHKLHYDVESSFWCLYDWLLGAKPSKDNTKSMITTDIWYKFTAAEDNRTHIIRDFPEDLLHPKYKPLEPLLKAMAEQISEDHDLAPGSTRRKEEYLPEALQRLIYMFLHDNWNKSFMVLKKSSECRQVIPDTQMTQKKTKQSESMRFSSSTNSCEGLQLDVLFAEKRKAVDELNGDGLANCSTPDETSPKKKRKVGHENN